MYAQFGKPERKLTSVNTIEYDMKSCQVMTTIVNCTDAQIKILKILTPHKVDVDTVNEYATRIQFLRPT